MSLTAILHSAILHAGLLGLAGAVIPDLHGFLNWKTLDQAKQFNWRLAALHYAQGFVGGMLASPFLTSILGSVTP